MSQSRNFFEEWKQKRAQQGEAEESSALSIGAQEAHAPLAEAPEDFQWSEERDQAIQRLLETTVPGTLPSVHKQLQAIRQGLQFNNLAVPRGRQLLMEVQTYLRQHLQAENRKPPVDHEDVTRARQEKVNALHAWQQSAQALQDYLDKREDVYFEVAAYAADQGSAFLASCRRLLLECEPEPE